jgi:Rnl2 family RNA ligase
MALVPWPFFEYDRIAEKADKWALDESLYRQIQKARWVVSEKIHGSNFSFVTDGKKIRCAKRKSYLEPDENFYAHEDVLSRIEPQLLDLFQGVKLVFPELVRIQLYGELFGGGYPHPDVPKVNNVQPIQTGVFYSPRIEFCAFDLSVEMPKERRFVSFEQLQEFLDDAELFYVKPLFMGSYEEALAYPIGFKSGVPKRLGLPAIANNKAEGIVIKPVDPIYVETEKGRARILLKKKIAEFSEDEKFFSAQKWSSENPLDALSLLSAALPDLANKNRLQSARSKVGPTNTPQKSAQLFQLFVEDILLQLEEDYAEMFQSLSAQEKKKLTKRAIEQARAALKKNT